MTIHIKTEFSHYSSKVIACIIWTGFYKINDTQNKNLIHSFNLILINSNLIRNLCYDKMMKLRHFLGTWCRCRCRIFFTAPAPHPLKITAPAAPAPAPAPQHCLKLNLNLTYLKTDKIF